MSHIKKFIIEEPKNQTVIVKHQNTKTNLGEPCFTVSKFIPLFLIPRHAWEGIL